MNQNTKNLLAIIFGVLPINIIMIIYRITQTENFSTIDMLGYPILFGGLNLILILLLNKYLVKSSFSDTFNNGERSFLWDIVASIILTVIYFILFYIERNTLYQWITSKQQESGEIINIIIDLAHNPLLMLIWFGPVLWIGVALFEEISRAFFLKCLWNINENKIWQLSGIVIVSVITGFLHLYQGTTGIISITIKGLILGYFFYKYKRILPLIISHGLYDGLQFAYIIIQIRQ